MSKKPDLSDEEFDRLLAGIGGGTEVETAWPDAVDWDTQATLSGKVVELETVTLDDRTTRRATIETPQGGRSLWEGASLRKLFDGLKPGMMIAIKFTGMKDLPGGRAQRQFRVAIHPGKG